MRFSFGFFAVLTLSQVSSTLPSAMLTAAEMRVCTMDAMVLLASWSALLPEIGASSIVSARSRSRLLAISSFSLKESTFPKDGPA